MTVPEEQKREKASDEIGMVSRNEYESLKRRAIEFEARNKRCIVMIPCDGNEDWCEMGDMSALIYKYVVCEKIGAPVNFSSDADKFYTKFKIGRVRTRGFSTVRRRLEKAGLYGREWLKDRCVIFELNEVIPDSEIARFLQLEKERQARINNITGVSLADPELYRVLSEVALRFQRVVVKRMGDTMREAVGIKMYRTLFRVLEMYHEVSAMRDKKKISEHWQVMRDLLKTILRDLQILSEQKAIKSDLAAEIGSKINYIITRMGRYIK